MRVLIVEDIALVAMHLAMEITGFGHEVCGIAAPASQALEQAISHAPLGAALVDQYVKITPGTKRVR